MRWYLRFKLSYRDLAELARELGVSVAPSTILPLGRKLRPRYEAGKRTGAWIKIKLHLEQEFIIGGYTEQEGSRKYFGALLVGFYEGKKLKFAGRVGTGFSDKLLSTLYSELNKIRVEKCPFYNLPAAGRSRWDQGLTAAEMRRCH